MADIYRTLQKHLNKQAVGFPATKSGAEIRILKRLFTTEEAKLALHLTYRPRTITDIHQTVKAEGMPLADLEKTLDNMVNKGAIERIERNNTNYYNTMPFVVGIFERQLNRLSPELLNDVKDLLSDQNFGLSLLSPKVPQMRTIPIEESIKVEHQVTTYDNLRELIEGTEGPISIQECICRRIATMKGDPCEKTSRLETCMCFGDWAKHYIESKMGRQITKEEALEIQRQNQADGLVLQPTNNQKVHAICACCGCCCGMLGLNKMLPKPVEFWASNYFASVDTNECNACGTCVETCQVGAVTIDEKKGGSVVNLNRCIGCGNCVPTCPNEAMSLVRKEKQAIPPKDVESLYEYIAENKPGTFGKLKLMTKLLTTNRPDLSKTGKWMK